MIQIRLGETYEEFEKRKRRVKLQSVPFGDMFAHGGGGGSGSVALANIIYNMDTFNVDASSFRTIDNAGSDGASSDGEMYGSNHAWLNGIDQSIDYPTVNGSDYGYFDVTTKAHIKFTASATTINITASHSNFFALDGTSITASDLTYLDANPEAVAKLVDGETVAGLSFVLADIHNFYPCNEGEASGAYIQDVSVALGSEEVANSDFATSDLTGWTFAQGSGVVVSGELETTSINATLSARYNFTSVAGKYYKFEFKVRAGTQIGHQYSVFDGENLQEITGSIPYDVADGEIGIIFKATGNDTGVYVQRDGVTTIGTTYFDDVSVREATAQEIANFTTSSRTTLENTNYGASNLLYKQDATGRWLSMADANLIEFTGDGRYVDVGFMPPSDTAWEIDFVMETLANGVDKWNGINSSALSENIYIGQGTGNKLFAFIGNTFVVATSVSSDGLHHVRVEFDGLGGGNLVIDNSLTASYSGSTYTYSAIEKLFIGAVSRGGTYYVGNEMNIPTGYFQYIEKERTPLERTADYNKAKANHPTLP